VRAHAGMPRWPLALIAAPAAVAVWSGWVGLGGLCGFGVIHPLPGILPGLQLDTAITLPVGVEAYGAYALGAWLAPDGVPGPARTFARRSAVGALALGMLGQVVYHLLAAAGAVRAPWPVVVLVSCMPVVTLGFGAALTHLLRVPEAHPESASAPVGQAHPAPAPGAPALNGWVHPERSPGAPSTRSAGRTRSAPVTPEDAEHEFMTDLAAGALPSLRQIRARLHVGQDRAYQIREHLERALTRA
jgi:hypothetical protein